MSELPKVQQLQCYGGRGVQREGGCAVGSGIKCSSQLHLDICAPASHLSVRAFLFFGDKEIKSNQLKLILLRRREEKVSETGWRTSDPHEAAVQAGGQVVTVKQHVLLRAESEDVEVRKQMLPLPPHYPQRLNILQKRARGSFCSSAGKISEFTVADCERFLRLFLGTFHKTTECKVLSLSRTYAHRC